MDLTLHVFTNIHMYFLIALCKILGIDIKNFYGHGYIRSVRNTFRALESKELSESVKVYF